MKILSILIAALALQTTSASSGFSVNTTLRSITYKVPSGTAALVRFEGRSYLISNWHVCRNFETEEVEASNEFYGESVKVKVLGMFPELDTCVMTDTGRLGAKLGKPVKRGFPVYSAGYPGGSDKLVLTHGYISDLSVVSIDFGNPSRCPADFDNSELKCRKSFELQDTTMVGAPGCSGSAMLNSKAEYVGLINSTKGINLSALSPANVIEAIRLLKP